MDATVLKAILLEEMKKYIRKGDGFINMPIFDKKRQHYLVTKIDYPSRKKDAELLLMARLIDDKLIIEDTLDKTLADALLKRGVPRDQLILVYEGENAPPPPVEHVQAKHVSKG